MGRKQSGFFLILKACKIIIRDTLLAHKIIIHDTNERLTGNISFDIYIFFFQVLFFQL